MKPSLVFLAAATTLVAAVSASAQLMAAPAPSLAVANLPPATRPGEVVLYGHVKSLTPNGSRFQLRFDPAWWLTGLTAKRAKLEDTGSSEVPNDYYIVEEGHRLLTYFVPATAHVTILTRAGIPANLGGTPITVSELAQIVKGRNPRGRQLMEPKAGFWIRVAGDTVRSLDQQYQP